MAAVRRRTSPSGGNPARQQVNLANGIGLVLAIVFTAFLVAALLFAEKF